MGKEIQLTRVCSSCGVRKPISAFLQLTGLKGTLYGQICASCRSQQAANKTTLKKEDDETGSRREVKLRLGAAERLEIARKQEQQFKSKEEAQKEELKKREKMAAEKSEGIEKKEQAAKTHRTQYIDAKKKGFLGFLTTQPAQTQTTKQSPVSVESTQHEAQATKEQVAKEQETIQQKENVTVKTKEDVYRQETRIATTTDFTTTVLSPQHFKMERLGQGWQTLEKWLGVSSPLMAELRKFHTSADLSKAPAAKETSPAKISQSMFTAQQQTAAKQSAASPAKPQQQQQQQPQQQQQHQHVEKPSEFIQSEWGPFKRPGAGA